MSLLAELNRRYLEVHVAKEEAFWAQKMGLSGYVQGGLEAADIAFCAFTGDEAWLARIDGALQSPDLSPYDRVGLQGWRRFFEVNVIGKPEAKQLQNDIIKAEGELERARAAMKLGYTDPATGAHVEADYLKLMLVQRTSGDEAVRKAAHASIASIERCVLDAGFLEVVKQRNRLGRMLGYEDYYDFKVSRNEGMGKKTLFGLLDALARDTREAGRRSIEALKKEKGESAGLAHNYGFFSSGTLTTRLDPYFPFRSALGVWGRAMQSLGVRYNGGELTLDLLSRPGKYENGFMHGPFPGYVDGGSGKFLPSKVNFTSLGAPGQVGSGYAMLHTLFHEGGHAAHFTNVMMPAPCFSQEFAPTSVAFAETQSMFFDSLVADADFRARYARDAQGRAIPKELMRLGVELNQKFFANMIRQMLVVPYVERAIYEMSESELTPENVLRAAREIERELTLLSASPRPTLSIPHLISGDSSAYYHGYVLAEMAVHQTREFFLERDGHLVDNPKIGPDLCARYWRPGNSRTMLELVKDLTGKPFSADAIVREANRDVPEAVERAVRAVAKLADVPQNKAPIDLDARIALIHGDQLVASNHHHESFAELDSKFAGFIDRFSA